VRGCTWQNYQLPNSCDYTVVGPNIAVCDIDPADASGSAWSPVRSCFINYIGPSATTKSLSFDSGCIAVLKTAAMHGFCVQGANGTVEHGGTVRGRAVAEVDMGTGYHGLLASDVAGALRVTDFESWGAFRNGANFQNVSKVEIGNFLIGGASDFAISASAGCETAMVRNGTIRSCACGTELSGVTTGLLENVVTDDVDSLEVSLAGTGGTLIMKGCVDIDGSGVVSDSGTNTKLLVAENPGYNADHRVAATQITSKTSKLNTWGKHAGKLAVDANNVTWIATGSGATDTWKKVEDGTTTTPA
jgi:hypothetical protein